jgi:putative ABC transport system ATP-binding protein
MKSDSATQGNASHHAHFSPVERFISLLQLDRGDIARVTIFALVAGILNLAIPLAVESLINVVSWGTTFQPLIVLALMLLTCLGFAGMLNVLQNVLVELIQRRQFVRIVSDLAHRFPRAKQESLQSEYPRELANRVFDIMTIQKASAILLLDGISILLTTILGLLLLAFYHPFLLGLDVVLVLAMTGFTWILGYGGVRTAIDESITKYKVIHWLQDVIASPAAFKTGGGEDYAIRRANDLTIGYIVARRYQFRVVLRQVVFAIVLQAIASSAVLGLGGWLVINGELTLGQLVATELVITVVVGAFAKLGKSLEKFYDLMGGIDKVGHLLDLETEVRQSVANWPAGPAGVQWDDLEFRGIASNSNVAASTIQAGDRVAIVGDDVTGREVLARTLAGLSRPTYGHVEVAGMDAFMAANGGNGKWIGYAGENDLFHGSLLDNVQLGRDEIDASCVQDALTRVQLSDILLKLPQGLDTPLQTAGYPLTRIQSRQLVLARAIVSKPSLLIIDGLLDELSTTDRLALWQALTGSEHSWTIVVNTNREDVAKLCNSQISVRRS